MKVFCVLIFRVIIIVPPSSLNLLSYQQLHLNEYEQMHLYLTEDKEGSSLSVCVRIWLIK